MQDKRQGDGNSIGQLIQFGVFQIKPAVGCRGRVRNETVAAAYLAPRDQKAVLNRGDVGDGSQRLALAGGLGDCKTGQLNLVGVQIAICRYVDENVAHQSSDHVGILGRRKRRDIYISSCNRQIFDVRSGVHDDRLTSCAGWKRIDLRQRRADSRVRMNRTARRRGHHILGHIPNVGRPKRGAHDANVLNLCASSGDKWSASITRKLRTKGFASLPNGSVDA